MNNLSSFLVGAIVGGVAFAVISTPDGRRMVAKAIEEFNKATEIPTKEATDEVREDPNCA